MVDIKVNKQPSEKRNKIKEINMSEIIFISPQMW